MTKPPLGYVTNVKIVSVVDGDTVEVEIVKRLRVRMLDCWCPETRTKDPKEKQLGLAAKARLTEIALGKPATLYVPAGPDGKLNDISTLSRVLGYVWVDGASTSLSEMQVIGKHAARNKGGKLGT